MPAIFLREANMVEEQHNAHATALLEAAYED
jgi:hypothetical protein